MIRTIIVEDESGARNRYSEMIDAYGEPFRVVGAFRSAREAIAAWSEIPPDLLFTDVRMPHMSGLEFLEERRAAGWEGVAVVISGYGEFSLAQEAIRVGVYDYLLKPVFPDDMQGLLHRISREIAGTQAALASRVIPDLEVRQLSRFVQRAIEFTEDHLEEHISLSRVAEAVFVSPAHLSAVFTRECAMTFIDFLHSIRVERAKDLLQNPDISLLDVAEQSGFADRSYLNRIFKRTTGTSPGAYRRKLSSDSFRPLLNKE